MASWKEWAMRVNGEDGYAFGDFTRGILLSVLLPKDTGTQGCSLESSSSTDSEPDPEDPEDFTKPLDHAVLALNKMQTCLRRFDSLNLPHCAHALDKIRMGVEELEARIEEAAAYQQLCPESGTLLQVQVCSAAGDEDPPDWSMGQLYASTDSLLFETSGSPRWRIGPVRWSEVTLERLREDGDRPSCAGDIRLVVSGGPVHLFSGLNHMDILKELGHMSDEVAVAGANSAEQGKLTTALAPEKEDPSDCLLSDIAKDVDPMPSGTTPHASNSWFDQYAAGSENQSADKMSALPASSLLHGKCMSRSLSRALTRSKSFVPVADSLPHEAPTEATPLVKERMPNATIEDICTLMSTDRDWPILSFLEEHLRLTDVQDSKWAPSQRIPGTQMRRLRFRMPVPTDVPQAVKRLVNLPDTTKVTFLARLGCSPDKVILVQEVCSHDVTYGENFWVQDVMTFNSDPSGGVILEKFTVIRWVTALPWYAAMLGPFIEAKAKDTSMQVGQKLVKYLEEGYGM